MIRNDKGQFVDGGFFGKHREDSKKKMSIAKLGKPSPRKGCHVTEETREKSRLSHLGKKQSPEIIEKRRLKMLGNTHGFKKGQIAPNKGKKIEKLCGKNNGNWKDGKSRGTRDKYASRPKPEQCEVCGAIGDICYDHDHKTNEFRGWLCRRCNLALGLVKDNIETLIALSEYLNNH